MGVNGLRGFWLIFLFTLFMSWAVAQARRSRGRRVGDSYLFPPIYAIPLILSAEICLGSTLVYLSRGDREASVILGLLLVVGPICAWPKGIVFFGFDGLSIPVEKSPLCRSKIPHPELH